MKAGVIAASAIFATMTKTKVAVAAGNNNGPGSNNHNNNNNNNNGPVSCFLRGTTIRTDNDDRRVEDLIAGDLLPTAFSGICPIRYIGRYVLRKSDSDTAWARDVLPVRVTKAAIAPDIPKADLYVTQSHALLIDGILVPVCNLINGTTITFYDAGVLDELEFFHIELERHDVIYAEGAPCETLVTVDQNVRNFAEYLRHNEDVRCAPWAGFGPRIEIKSRFRSAIAPWVDRRQKLDVIRENLEQRGIALFGDRNSVE